MDPLRDFGRNDPCWCGAARKYKACHGRHQPPSVPGQPIVHPDDADRVWLSPTTSMTRDALRRPDAGVPLVLPLGRPQSRPVDIDPAVQVLLDAPRYTTQPLPVLGKQRFEVFDHTQHDRDALADGVADIAVAVSQALGELDLRPGGRPTILWNDEVDAARFVGQTLLFADHVCVPDRVFAALIDDRDDDTVREAIAEQRRLRPLIEAGVVVPVPEALGVAAQAGAVDAMTQRDLRRRDLTDWVRSQLIVEGPTAREAMFINAIDDFDSGQMWLLSRRTVVNEQPDGRNAFTADLLGNYDPAHDYDPWKQQNLDKAVGEYLRHANERLIAGKVFAADYLTTSPFRARLLARKGALPDQPIHSAVWADIPILPGADPATVARAAAEDEAVEDLRQKVRNALRGARDLGAGADALTGLGDELAHASRKLQAAVHTERRWKVLVPALAGLGAIALGAAGPAAIVGGVLSVVGGLVPNLADSAARRREAAYLFYLANRTPRLRR
ncbi:SEC-C domain-containing protein [Paractinoplanes lichenicola]|uniref:SEC-C domain-containing protein n=1 Tax=Paractinoplanes lichenicola TaxID=2802976 RepID=A0ABS1W4D1_9ACTN|nr:SEC-C domain-containing protein [Actinoplanes lichenicola]MBL7261577.1 SEC-C domain-containing protein [Actinoplanes lichenicola]